MKWSPSFRMFIKLIMVAACPDVVHKAPTPPSIAAIFSSTAATVGLEMREYMCPAAVKSNNFPICSVESYLNVVLW